MGVKLKIGFLNPMSNIYYSEFLADLCFKKRSEVQNKMKKFLIPSYKASIPLKPVISCKVGYS